MQSQDLSSCLAALQGAQTPSQDSILSLARACVPPLGEKTSKGEAGRVGVIGGSFEYTGAPYFAAYTALRAGSDIVHIFCETRAGGPIKSYSPELIVHPLLLVSDDPTEERGAAAYQQLSEWVARLDGILLGPGLGRDELVLQTCSRLLLLVAELGKPMILDADGLYILTQAIREGERGSSLQKQLLGAMRTAHVTLTPNKVEFERLCRALKVGEEEEDKLGKAAELACSVAGRIGENVVLVVKGSSDVICSDSSTWLCDDKGSLRRAGGQGDVLAGLMLTFAVWGNSSSSSSSSSLPPPLVALMERQVAKLSALKAFEKKKRAMTASDVMEEVRAE
ncbi:hypothetical protein GUITHDRAFT_68606 [Guillardia theta CCMP2712]|uniref:ATP-dependent (S)-NAD(P)H-hydrate dehydratase n=1 Tax=Guillardia theta (strain CCMP2712) TaxID=905079 RepID=L1JJD0_GUITC|nr:hypothetical protein GUITHDRAFT_68606 [Guillardia theta CCMP2712]EKX48606.1 hypothetical protein GUITHDRAFT_68606 [Guillardia theta CCMP2712]|eukprot:XP_005835586.1 hypothetical protein GUITHDRAFT_68606 [Guillardia theta CCMP2712]